MFKNDNHLLSEWIAYHYTILPLRHLVIGTDVDNTQDPRHVLKEWTGLPLEVRILNASQFVDPQPQPQELSQRNKVSAATVAHHEFANRQKGFLRHCTQLLRRSELWTGPVTWTTYIDSDEFVTWNPWDASEPALSKLEQQQQQQQLPFVQKRKQLLSQSQRSRATVLEFLHEHGDALFWENGNRTICYTLPRLRFGALENHTCPVEDAPPVLPHKTTISLPQQHLGTLRFLQHAAKDDFSRNKFGKVIMDVSQLSDHVTQHQQPRNIHRPWIEYCGPAAKPLRISLLRLNHYLGSWERYSGRSKDDRRSRDYWEQMASLQGGQACGDTTHHWLAQFVEQVGHERASAILNA